MYPAFGHQGYMEPVVQPAITFLYGKKAALKPLLGQGGFFV